MLERQWLERSRILINKKKSEIEAEKPKLDLEDQERSNQKLQKLAELEKILTEYEKNLEKEKKEPVEAKKVEPRKNAHHVLVDVDGVLTHQIGIPTSSVRKLLDIKDLLQSFILDARGKEEELETLLFLKDLISKKMAIEMMATCAPLFKHMIEDANKNEADLIVHVGSNRQFPDIDAQMSKGSVSIAYLFPLIPETIANLGGTMQVISETHLLNDSTKNKKSGDTFLQIITSQTFKPIKVSDTKQNAENDSTKSNCVDPFKQKLVKHQAHLAMDKYKQYAQHTLALYDDMGKNILMRNADYFKEHPNELPLTCFYYQFPVVKVNDGVQAYADFLHEQRQVEFKDVASSQFTPEVHLIAKVVGTGKPDPKYQEQVKTNAPAKHSVLFSGETTKPNSSAEQPEKRSEFASHPGIATLF